MDGLIRCVGGSRCVVLLTYHTRKVLAIHACIYIYLHVYVYIYIHIHHKIHSKPLPHTSTYCAVFSDIGFWWVDVESVQWFC